MERRRIVLHNNTCDSVFVHHHGGAEYPIEKRKGTTRHMIENRIPHLLYAFEPRTQVRQDSAGRSSSSSHRGAAFLKPLTAIHHAIESRRECDRGMQVSYSRAWTVRWHTMICERLDVFQPGPPQAVPGKFFRHNPRFLTLRALHW